MGETTGIAWCDATLNFWVGCTPVSAGCNHCYAAREMLRYGQDPRQVRRTVPATWALARRLERQAAASGTRPHVFACSWSDFCHPAADAWRDEAWAVIRDTPHLVWIILTKRTDRLGTCLPPDWGAGWPHVLLGATLEHEVYETRLVQLLRLPSAAGYVLSLEPLLGRIPMGMYLWRNVCGRCGGFVRAWSNDGHYEVCLRCGESTRWYRPQRANIRAVYLGGESGPDARPLHPAWVREVRDACQEAGVPLCFKQWGEWVTEDQAPEDAVLPGTSYHPWLERGDQTEVYRLGRHKTGRALDGQIYDGRPEVF